MTMRMKTTKHTTRTGILGAIALMIVTTLPASAQGSAEVWLHKATEKLQNKGTEIAFRISDDGMRISGKLLIEDKKFIYDTAEMKIWYDGTTQWTMQTGNGYNELYINNPSPEEQQAINPYILLSNYKDNFTATDAGEKTLDGKLVHQVKLEAHNENQELTDVNVYILSNGNIAAIELVAPDERVYEIEIRAMRNGLTFPKDTFSYNTQKYPADEVIDLR